MESSKNGRWIIPFMKFSRLRVKEYCQFIVVKIKIYALFRVSSSHVILVAIVI